MTLASPNEKWMRVADIVRRFCHFLLWRREFCFDLVGNFGLKKMTPNCNALAKSIISYLWISYYTFVFSWQCKTMLFTTKKHAVTSSERAHSITWYKQKRRRNRWASKQVSWRKLRKKKRNFYNDAIKPNPTHACLRYVSFFSVLFQIVSKTTEWML